MTGMRLRLPHVIRIILICIPLLYYCYAPVIDAPPFDGDDVIHASRSRLLADGNLHAWLRALQFEEPSEVELLYRPVIVPIFLADYLLSPGRMWGGRVINLTFHLANAVLLFMIARQMGLTSAAGTAGAIMYAVHPMLALNVSYVACTPYITIVTQFCLCLYLMRSYFQTGSHLRLGVALGLFTLGVLELETIVSMPIMLIAANEWLSPLPRERRRRRIPIYAVLFLLIVLHYAVVFLRIRAMDFPQAYAYARVRMWDRLTDLHIGPLAFVALPFKALLSPVSEVVVSSAAGTAIPWVSAGLLVVLMLAGRPYDGTRRRIVLFGIVWAAATFLPTYPEIQGAQVDWGQSKYYYLPFSGLILAIAALLPRRPADRQGAAPMLAAALAVLLLVPITRLHTMAL
ncbi:hypothetical protein JW905_15970, partial [bacterium]|nr:hypothetical protein [candidate division CSSED10-310 bacterium]